jgi:hypothetical protein
MWDTLQQQSFLIGAALVLIYQAAKFSQLDVTDPVTSRYIALLPGASVRDFAGPYAYHVALTAFLAVSLAAYFVFCHISPDILAGAGKLFGNPDAAKLMQGVPYPLYVAALFMGLTQPIIPLLSQFADAQRNFFHDRIEVPKRVIDVSESLVAAIEARAGSNKKLLTTELRHLVSAEFIASLRNQGDVAFYRQQIETLGVDDEAALSRVIRESSPRDLRGIIKRLVLGALIAVMRQSGPQALIRVAKALGAPDPQQHQRNIKFLVASVISSGVLFSLGLLLIAHILWLLNGPVTDLFGRTPANSLWPVDLPNVGGELLTIVPPIFICLLIAVSLLVPRDVGSAGHAPPAPNSSLVTDFVEFFRASASVLGLCILVSILIKVGQLFYEYNTFLLPSEARSPSRLVLPVVQSFIPVSLSLFTTWYLVSCARAQHRGPSFAGTLLVVAGSTALIAWLYSLTFVATFLQQYPQYAPAREYVLFGVAANVLVSVCAFASVTLFFKSRHHLPEAEQNRGRRVRGSGREGSDGTQDTLRQIYNGVRSRIAERRAHT